MESGIDAACVIVVPALNEEKHIKLCLESLVRDIKVDYSIFVVDGGSTDRTREIVTGMMNGNKKLNLLHNPKRFQSSAVNMVVRRLGSGVEWLIRADAHLVYPVSFVDDLVVVARSTGAGAVVVPMQAQGKSCFQRAAAAAQNSRLGNGGALHRGANQSQYVDHGHHALFKLKEFQDAQGYDESFSHNEDFEFDHRFRRLNGSIWLEASGVVRYIPRGSASALCKQYFFHGKGRARTTVKHRLVPKVRQVLPLAVLGWDAVGLCIASIHPVAFVLPLSHLAICLGWGFSIGIKLRDRCAVFSGFAAFLMHLCWAAGMTYGLAVFAGHYLYRSPRRRDLNNHRYP